MDSDFTSKQFREWIAKEYEDENFDFLSNLTDSEKRKLFLMMLKKEKILEDKENKIKNENKSGINSLKDSKS